MEVLVGSTFTIDVPSSPPPQGQTAEERLFLNGVSECPEEEGVPAAFRISGEAKFFAGGSLEPESSSSIGTADDSDEEEEVQSELKGRTGLGSLDALEDSLPIKLVPFVHTLFSILVNIEYLISSYRSFLFWVVKIKICVFW